MNKVDKVKEYAHKIFKSWFDNAPTGQGKPLKNYTSGDGDHVGFESITEKIMLYALKIYGLKDRSKVNGDYFIDDKGIHDKQRMDNHVWIDGKVVIVEENRAWIDKPFYTLKRAVVQSFMTLPHVKNCLSDDIIFIFSSLARDVTDVTKSTSDVVFGYSDHIAEVNFSGRPRRSYKFNYFDNGYSETELLKYVETLCGVFSKYEK